MKDNFSVSLFLTAIVKLQEFLQNYSGDPRIFVNDLSCACQCDDAGGYGNNIFGQEIAEFRRNKPFIDLSLDKELFVYECYKIFLEK